MRLILHTAAYWLMLTVRDVIPKAHALAAAEFATLRLRLLNSYVWVILGEPDPSRLWSTPSLDDMHDNALPSRQTANKGFFEG